MSDNYRFTDKERFEREEIEARQKKRLGSTVRDIMLDDDDFEDVETGQEVDPFSIKIALHDFSDYDYEDTDYEDVDIDSESDSDADSDSGSGAADAAGAGASTNDDEYEKWLRERREREREEYIDERRREIRRRLSAEKIVHKDIIVASIFFVVLFLGIIGYLVYFNAYKSAEYLANEYNAKRQSIFTDRYIRGDIETSDGVVVATTKETNSGDEYRYYPEGNVYAHAIGYSTRGCTGVESLANSSLLGSSLSPLIVAQNELNGEKTQGDTVVTTLNSRLQQAAYDALGDNKGAIIVTEVKSGKVLAMVSKPDYDPNEIDDIWDELVSDEDNSNLVNRATQGLYAPGSTFKILTLLEYMREYPNSFDAFTFDCDSVYEDGDYAIKCAHSTAHGEQTLKEAFANSCNGAFAKIGKTLNIDKLYDLCEEAGYNSKPDTDILSSASRFKLTSETADTWSILQTAIGQGETVTTPLQNLLIVNAIANGGTIMKPYIIDHIENCEGTTTKTYSASTSKKIMTSSEAETLGEYLRAVVTSGTGGKAEGDGYGVAGKTGSAQWKSDEDTHAWFVGYAPYDDPEISVCVLVENAGSGGSVAAPMAREIFDTYFND